MKERAYGISWEAPEHHHLEPSTDWYWVLGIGAITLSAIVFFFGNFLLAVLILVGAVAIGLAASKPVATIPFAVSTRGVRVGDRIFPYSTLESFYLDEDGDHGPEVLLKTGSFFMPLIIFPIPEEHFDEIESILESKLPEEHLEEPFLIKVLEFFRF